MRFGYGITQTALLNLHFATSPFIVFPGAVPLRRLPSPYSATALAVLCNLYNASTT